MASSLSILNSLLQNPYAQTALQGTRTPVPDALKPGATLTARYTVQEDGELALRDVNVAEDALDSNKQDGGSNQRALTQQSQKEYSFTDLARPKAVLNPTDELSLFAASESDSGNLTASNPVGQKAVNGAGVTDVVLEATPVAPQNLAAQQQYKVADLYARNNDIIYNVTPAYTQAA